jgi:EAL domain-containing protein (putative c-di-GMP-specific phosphodiesterase class I)
LKIDRSFIHAIKTAEEEACIVNAIISMALGLKLHIVAEGVESATQLSYLRSLGCQTVQGYLFGQAVPLDELMKRLGNQAPLVAASAAG